MDKKGSKKTGKAAKRSHVRVAKKGRTKAAKRLTKKKKLANAAKKIKRIPAFAIIRTKRKVSHNKNRRNWRTEKLRIKE